jgi:hypothetical protein
VLRKVEEELERSKWNQRYLDGTHGTLIPDPLLIDDQRQSEFLAVLPHLEMLPKVWKHFWSNFDLADGVKQSTGRSFMQHTEAGWRSGGGLCWRAMLGHIQNRIQHLQIA